MWNKPQDPWYHKELNIKYFAYTMLEQLFGSKTRLKVLRVLYREPEKPFFVRELARAVGVQINAVRRELELLVSIGLLQEIEKEAEDTSKSGATLRKYYQLN
ncbi:MAG: hypothetical protein COU33_02995, partial [Candidatus Magasanikbacteria bacterium CG10_big_fil_rev_8_21_14_0_10_43_6]